MTRLAAFRACSFFFILAVSLTLPSQTPDQLAGQGQTKVSLAKLPLSFEKNVGQVDSSVKFLARGPGYTILLTDTEAVLALRDANVLRSGKEILPGIQQQGTQRKIGWLRMHLVGANPRARLTASDELPGKINYFPAGDARTWHTNIATFSRVKYAGIYPGIDLVYHGSQHQLEYDWIVSPGADPRSIRIHFSGTTRLRIDANGDLVIDLASGQLRQHKPRIFQSLNETEHVIAGNFVRLGPSDVGFSVAAYDRRYPLIIDPVLQYSTYLGGRSDDFIDNVALDSLGNIFIAGTGTLPYFTGGSLSDLVNHQYLFAAKLNASGTQLLYTSFINTGTGYGTEPTRMAVDSAGAAYVSGVTDYAGYATVNAYQPFINGGSIFLSNDSGGAWTPSGAGITDLLMNQVAIDPSNPKIMYAHGPTIYSHDLYKTVDGGSHWSKITPPLTVFDYDSIGGFAISPANSSVVYASSVFDFFKSVDGGTTWTKLSLPPRTFVNFIVVDPRNPDIVYAGGYHDLYGSTDGAKTWTLLKSLDYPGAILDFKLAPSDPSILYLAIGVLSGTSTGSVLRKSGGDFSAVWTGAGVNAIAINARDANSGLAATDSGLLSFGNEPAVTLNDQTTAVAFSPSSDSVIFVGTFAHGVLKSMDGGASFQTASLGPRYINSFSFTPANSSIVVATAHSQGHDSFVTKFSADGSRIEYSSFIGGSREEYGAGMAVAPDGTIYLAGTTTSTDFPTTKNGRQPQPRTPEKCKSTPSDSLTFFCANSFLMALRPDGSAPIFSSYFGGGSSNTWGGALARDSLGNLYLAGETQAADFPATAGSFQTKCSGDFCDDGFVSKFDSSGNLVAATFLGGTAEDYVGPIAIDNSGDVYVSGQSWSTDFPLVNPFQQLCRVQSKNGCVATFLTKLKGDLSSIVYSTNLAGTAVRAIAVDGQNRAYMVGTAGPPDFPTVNAIQPEDIAGICGDSMYPFGCQDGFITVFNPDGLQLFYSTYLGGQGQNQIADVALGSEGTAYVVGWTGAFDFPVTSDALQGKSNAAYDSANSFISKINPEGQTHTDFSLDLAQTSATVQAGSKAVFNFTLLPADGGLYNHVTFSCSGLPSGASCLFNPDKATVTTSPVKGVLIITVPAKTASIRSLSPWSIGHSDLFAYLMAFGIAGILFATPLRRKNVKLASTEILLSTFVVIGCFVLWGCGSSPAPTPVTSAPSVAPPPPPPPAPSPSPSSATYTVVVTATAGSLQHSASVKLTVN